MSDDPAAGAPAPKPRSMWSRAWSTASANKWLLAGTGVVGLLILCGLCLVGIAMVRLPAAPAGPTATAVTRPGTDSATATPVTWPRTEAATATPGAVTGQAPPAIRHGLTGRDNCLICHNPAGGVKPGPKDHAGWMNSSCQGCHKAAAPASPAVTRTAGPGPGAGTTPPGKPGEASPAIPHSLAGRDNCLVCHNPYGSFKPPPKDHAGRTNDSCQGCHKPRQ